MTVWFISWFFASTFRHFGSIFAYLSQGALSELFYCKVRIQNSLKCVFLIDKQRWLQFVRHFVLPGKNAVLQPPPGNFQIRQTMCDTLFVRFSNGAMNDQTTVNPPVLLLFSNWGFRVACCLHYALCFKNWELFT